MQSTVVYGAERANFIEIRIRGNLNSHLDRNNGKDFVTYLIEAS